MLDTRRNVVGVRLVKGSQSYSKICPIIEAGDAPASYDRFVVDGIPLEFATKEQLQIVIEGQGHGDFRWPNAVALYVN